MSSATELSELASPTLFRSTPAETLAAPTRRGVPCSYARNRVIFFAGDPPRGWFIVVEGRVGVVRGSGARQHVVHTEDRGGTLGEVPLRGRHRLPDVAALIRIVRE